MFFNSLFHHLTISLLKDWIHKYFTGDELKDVQSAIDEVERKTIGEIVLSLRNKRTLLEKLYKKHELAIKDFGRLGVGSTKEKTGILIFIIFEEKYYDILADEGIYAKIPDKVWNELEEKLKDKFQTGKYSEGIVQLVETMGEILANEFPARAGAADDDEISDEIVVN